MVSCFPSLSLENYQYPVSKGVTGYLGICTYEIQTALFIHASREYTYTYSTELILYCMDAVILSIAISFTGLQ